MIPAWWTRLLLALLVVVMTIVGARFHRKQNAPGQKIGGRIALAKLLWLSWAIAVWFFVCPFVALDPGVGPPLRWSLGLFAASMWLRGAVELYMMYVSKSWRPPYGIAHDLCSIALLGGCLAWFHAELPGLVGYDRWVLGLCAAVLLSLVAETIYAVGFHKVVAHRTTGDDAVWFASSEDPKFRRLVRLTVGFNIPLFGYLAVFLAVSLGGGW